jgi:hypothetical protein
MKTYFFVLSIFLFFSLSLEAQAVKRVTKKPKTSQQKVGKLKPVDKTWGTRDSLPWVKAPGTNTPQTRGEQPNTNRSSLPFKGTDEELQTIQSKRQLKGTNKVVDHKADDQKIRKGNRRVVDHKAEDQKVRKGPRSVVDHKADDQKFRKGNRSVVDHKAEDQKVRKGPRSAGNYKANNQKLRKGPRSAGNYKANNQKFRKGNRKAGNRKANNH